MENKVTNKFVIIEDTKKVNKIKQILMEAYEFEERENPNCIWFLKGKNCSVFYYKNKKLFFQGKEAEYLFNLVEIDNYITINNKKYKLPICGTDEAGKGDYFGPLVTAAVAVTDENIKLLSNLNLQDSKKIDRDKLRKLAFEIKKIAPTTLIVLNNAKYNEVYKKYRNMNKILSYSHYLAIVNLFKKIKFKTIIVDKFGKEEYLNWLLRNYQYEIIQETEGERYLPVAAASIVAKDKYLYELNTMSIKYDFDFKPGSTPDVKELVKKFKEEHSETEVNEVLKLNFKVG
ncbi:MAG TPA: ribonuclease HIII [bacterium]|nr:ribonuclease HIII [bacterium]HOL48108.1 ribonuclease HIII [bacterium]HPQ18101.1 ribonuclease HIII [bacterium]